MTLIARFTIDSFEPRPVAGLDGVSPDRSR
jgi:hypothetical protein